ncbi:hypothetical protein LMH87_010182 [Akanthomyces muscarius]|uniref:Uncharacterized protein n=1 Tax=Akanthomyces muscarius TaxID=2231603 RepID=A0A9W8QCT8_AKAMU|nr:hypothetical protein LMH87_010182 [Akanthomyces muscarius]KAJ4153708.1 hypothetical protein LMH87_010182 [Akanthomyces muscarius]
MIVTLVTGGNRGIGYAIVKLLAARLASPTIIIGCRDVAAGKRAVDELRGEGMKADLDVVRMDIEDDNAIQEAVAVVSQKYGKLDYLVNNAARVTRPESEKFEDIRRAANEVYNNGVTSNEVVTRAFLPLLRKATSPRVVMVSSARGSIGMTAAKQLPPAAVVSYCVSKAALNMLTLHLQLEEDSRGDGEARVGYWAVSPGHCNTAFNGFKGRKKPEEGAEMVARLLEAEAGEFEAGTFWQYEDGVLEEVKW